VEQAPPDRLVLPDPLVLLVEQAPPDRLVLPDPPVLLVEQAPPDRLVLLVRPVLLVALDPPVPLVQPVLQDAPVWMVIDIIRAPRRLLPFHLLPP